MSPSLSPGCRRLQLCLVTHAQKPGLQLQQLPGGKGPSDVQSNRGAGPGLGWRDPAPREQGEAGLCHHITKTGKGAPGWAVLGEQRGKRNRVYSPPRAFPPNKPASKWGSKMAIALCRTCPLQKGNLLLAPLNCHVNTAKTL